MAESVEAAVSDANAAIGAIADAASEQAAEIAEAAIEAAEERVAAAEGAAQAISDAAMLTALGQRVGEVERGFEEWQNRIQMALSSFQQMAEEIRTEMRELMAKPAAVIVTPSAPAEPSLIPQPSQEPNPPPALIVTPESVNEAAPVVVETPEPVRPKRRTI